MTTSISPSIVEALRLFVGGYVKSMRAVAIGKVVRWDATKQAADIEPLVYELLTQEDGTREAVKPDVIPLVPVAMLNIGGFRIQVTPAINDIVTLFVSDREIETWLQGTGGSVAPETDRSHDINDSIAFPWAPAPWASPLSDIDSNELIIGRSDNSGEIRIQQDGTIKAGARGASTRGVARLDDSTVVDASTDSNMVGFMAAVHAAFSAPPVPMDGGAAMGVAYAAALAASGSSLPTSIAGKITSASDAMEVE